MVEGGEIYGFERGVGGAVWLAKSVLYIKPLYSRMSCCARYRHVVCCPSITRWVIPVLVVRVYALSLQHAGCVSLLTVNKVRLLAKGRSGNPAKLDVGINSCANAPGRSRTLQQP